MRLSFRVKIEEEGTVNINFEGLEVQQYPPGRKNLKFGQGWASCCEAED